MTDIVLTTLNAKFIHASFGLRSSMANLGELRPRAHLVEFNINQRHWTLSRLYWHWNLQLSALGFTSGTSPKLMKSFPHYGSFVQI